MYTSCVGKKAVLSFQLNKELGDTVVRFSDISLLRETTLYYNIREENGANVLEAINASDIIEYEIALVNGDWNVEGNSESEVINKMLEEVCVEKKKYRMTYKIIIAITILILIVSCVVLYNLK